MRDSGQLLSIVHRGMVKAGLDVNAIYMRLGYNTERIGQRELRTPHQMQAMFWEIVEVVSGDPDISLRLCPHLPVFRGDVLEYLMFSSPTFGEGAQRALKYLRIISDALNVRMLDDAQGPRVVLRGAAASAPQLRHTEICFAYGLIQFAQSVSDGQFKPLRVRLRASRRGPQAHYDRVFGCPVLFDGETSEVWFNPEILGYRSPRWDPDLLRLHEEWAAKRLSGLERQDLIEKIRRVFTQRLELEECSLEEVARELDIAPRRLRFELMRANTSFSKLLNDFRFALARKLLRTTQEPIENIVYLTGFSEPSTFYRAFKRWAGVTPVHYRENPGESPVSLDLA